MSDVQQRQDPRLDTAAGCAQVLAEIDTELARIPSAWSTAIRNLAAVEADFEVAEAVAFLAAEGDTATERKAKALKALSENSEATERRQRCLDLRADCEALSRAFKVYDRRSSNVQSLLNYHRSEGRYGEVMPDAKEGKPW